MDPSTILQRPYPRLGLQKGHPQLPAGGLGGGLTTPLYAPCWDRGHEEGGTSQEPHLNQHSRPNLSSLGPSPEE